MVVSRHQMEERITIYRLLRIRWKCGIWNNVKKSKLHSVRN